MNDQEHKCQCDFRIRMLGDGCRYCQPQEYIDRLHDTMDGMIHTDCFELTDEEINVVAILQDAEIVPVGHEIWKTGEEFNKYKRIVLATAKALRKASEK